MEINTEFEKWLSQHKVELQSGDAMDITPIFDDNYYTYKVAFAAGQSASAARIAELESEVKKLRQWQSTQIPAWEKVCDDWKAANEVLESERQQIYGAFIGRDGMHLPLFDALKERFKAFWDMESERDQLLADCKAMAEGIAKAHRCLHSGDPETCLLDIGELCNYNNRTLEKCTELGICTCPACLIAAKYKGAE